MLLPGQTINDTYRIERTLGSGGMADVYLVTHTRMRKQFAMKVMRLDGPGREMMIERFEREVDVLATLKHPNIVAIIDNNRLPDGSPYLVMEYLEGEDLGSFLARSAPLSLPVALRIIGQIGDALLTAHQSNVVHRDLKPGNIFLCKQGSSAAFVKVLDFGIAKVTQVREGKSGPTRMGLMGTPAYMSPEQAQSKHELIDARSDQFALAVIIYEMLSGRHPFVPSNDEGDIFVLLNRIVKEEPALLGTDQPQIERALRRALSKDPVQRFPSLREFMGALGASTQTVFQALPTPLVATTTGGRSGELLPVGRVGLRGRSLLFATVTGLLIAGSWLFWPRANVAVVANNDPGVPGGVNDQATASEPEPCSLIDAGEAADLHSADSAEAAVAQAPPSPPPPRRNKVLLFRVRGVEHRAVESLIRMCLERHVSKLSGLPSVVNIRLERSGTLQLTSAPAAVMQSSFDTCLEQALLKIDTQILPKIVTIVGERN